VQRYSFYTETVFLSRRKSVKFKIHLSSSFACSFFLVFSLYFTRRPIIVWKAWLQWF